MKGFSKLLILSAVLALAGCGKNNESGKSSGNGPCLQFGVNGSCNQYASLPGGINSGLGINSNLSQIFAQIPCETMGGYGGVMNRTQQVVQLTASSLSTAGHSYLGVTSYGDIAIVVGNGSRTVQATIYMCGGQMQIGQMGPLNLGEYPDEACPIKTISVVDLGSRVFRDPRGGRGATGQPFSFCRRMY